MMTTAPNDTAALLAEVARRARHPQLIATIALTDKAGMMRARVYLDRPTGEVVAEHDFPVNPFDRFQRDAHQAACRWAYALGARRVDGPVTFWLSEERDGSARAS